MQFPWCVKEWLTIRHLKGTEGIFEFPSIDSRWWGYLGTVARRRITRVGVPVSETDWATMPRLNDRIWHTWSLIFHPGLSSLIPISLLSRKCLEGGMTQLKTG